MFTLIKLLFQQFIQEKLGQRFVFVQQCLVTVYRKMGQKLIGRDNKVNLKFLVEKHFFILDFLLTTGKKFL